MNLQLIESIQSTARFKGQDLYVIVILIDNTFLQLFLQGERLEQAKALSGPDRVLHTMSDVHLFSILAKRCKALLDILAQQPSVMKYPDDKKELFAILDVHKDLFSKAVKLRDGLEHSIFENPARESITGKYSSDSGLAFQFSYDVDKDKGAVNDDTFSLSISEWETLYEELIAYFK
jgi:hypothetical protein